jgi:hypothetical protein
MNFIETPLFCLLILVNELLLGSFCWLLHLPTDKLTWVVDLIVVLIILMLLNTLWWLPTSGLAFILSSRGSLALALLLKHHLLELWIYLLSHIRELGLLHLIWGRLEYNLLVWHYKSLLLHILLLLINIHAIGRLRRREKLLLWLVLLLLRLLNEHHILLLLRRGAL